MISSWNVNGFRAFNKKPYFNEYMKESQPDIICFNETKINADTLYLLTGSNDFIKCTKGYIKFWNFSIAKKGYSGTAIFTKYKPISVKKGLGITKHD